MKGIFYYTSDPRRNFIINLILNENLRFCRETDKTSRFIWCAKRAVKIIYERLNAFRLRNLERKY